MKLNTLLILILLLTFKYSLAQNITPVQIERSQEILKEEDALRKKIEQPQKISIKEIILPQGFTISKNDIQELLGILSQAYQKACSNNKPPETTYIIDQGNLIINFND